MPRLPPVTSAVLPRSCHVESVMAASYSLRSQHAARLDLRAALGLWITRADHAAQDRRRFGCDLGLGGEHAIRDSRQPIRTLKAAECGRAGRRALSDPLAARPGTGLVETISRARVGRIIRADQHAH